MRWSQKKTNTQPAAVQLAGVTLKKNSKFVFLEERSWARQSSGVLAIRPKSGDIGYAIYCSSLSTLQGFSDKNHQRSCSFAAPTQNVAGLARVQEHWQFARSLATSATPSTAQVFQRFKSFQIRIIKGVVHSRLQHKT